MLPFAAGFAEFDYAEADFADCAEFADFADVRVLVVVVVCACVVLVDLRIVPTCIVVIYH